MSDANFRILSHTEVPVPNFSVARSFNALLRVELAIYPMFVYKRLLMFNINIHLTSCFSSLDILAIFFNTESFKYLSFLCIRTAVHEWRVSISFVV